jgi:peptidoglycan/LPS O-acetylase OafA/YrhL
MARPRLEALDGLRFLAALSVVAYHFTAMDRVWWRPAETVFPDQPFTYGWLGVHLFFLISGFVICLSAWDRTVGEFLTSRAVRLYPAYWLSVVVAVVAATFWPFLVRDVSVESTLVNLTMFQEGVGVAPLNEVYWTLWAELRFYLIFSLVVWWGLNYQRVVTFCVVWLGLVTVAKAVVPDGTIVHTVLMTDYAPLFTGGIGFYLLYRFGPARTSWAIVAVSFLLAVPAARFRASMAADPGQVVAQWPAVVLLAVCFLLVGAVALGWLSWVRGRWVVALGATTYPLYLLHLDIGGAVLNRLQWTVPPALLVTVVAAAMIVLAWLVQRYVERPVAALMKRVLSGMSTRVNQRVRA